MAQLGFYINQSLCIGCKACTVACKDKNNLDVGINFRRVYPYEEGTFVEQPSRGIVHNIKAYYFSISCNHCKNAACIPSCPTGAIVKNKQNGVVTITQDVCQGAQLCIKACPYGAPQYNKKVFKSNKCDFCVDLQEKGEEPVCVAACPMRAIEFGPIEELRKKYGTVSQIKGMPSDTLTQPNLVINPHRDARLSSN
ncbi:dimethylsulfoxide reductase, chain B [Bacillus sp. AFS076308]|uniref:DMSO/selenate family reductase complex B subunit n=1 Tax=unclassified Bacillus (in: firmicutes) TaxID=185979 RepID=UPI000BF58395|nr:MULTISPECIES: DMSO/selenate family reductase complex B subunit [unclassified Bacillus (in: firmicutes)]PFO04837.1 dimethylsulfoxide reductase, chain B [Bacillus sp. AFS076308]PGV47487.1 dimethylsulfoxide reductase, chain B [Bacillus sp. AFS037270]